MFPEYPLNASLLLLQGANASALEKEIGPEQFPVNEHYFGLVNVCTSDNTTALSLSFWLVFVRISPCHLSLFVNVSQSF